MTRTSVALLAFSLCTGTLAAEVLPQAIEACASLRRDAERLACFDKAVAALQAGEATTGVTAENMFGASTDTQTGAGKRAQQREELQQISGIVTSLRTTDGGMIILELDNGQVWRQQDSDVRMMVAKGDKVTIVRASMGTFRIADKSGRFARFKRVR
jgi:hypothetical protein